MKQTHTVDLSIAFWKSSCPLTNLGTLTAVESFLTISSGPEVTNITLSLVVKERDCICFKHLFSVPYVITKPSLVYTLVS